MEQAYVIEMVDAGRTAFLIEKGGELYLTFRREEVAVYLSELAAMCALVYVADHHRPRVVCVQKAAPKDGAPETHVRTKP